MVHPRIASDKMGHALTTNSAAHYGNAASHVDFAPFVIANQESRGLLGRNDQLWMKRMEPAPLRLSFSQALAVDGSVEAAVSILGGLESLTRPMKTALQNVFHDYRMDQYRGDMVSVERYVSHQSYTLAAH